MSVVQFMGQRRDGVAISGAVEESPAALAERLFEQRVRWADLHRDGELVGGVVLNEGKRTWWGMR